MCGVGAIATEYCEVEVKVEVKSHSSLLALCRGTEIGERLLDYYEL